MERATSPDDDLQDMFYTEAYQPFIDGYDPEADNTEADVETLVGEYVNMWQVVKHDRTGLAVKEVFEYARRYVACVEAKKELFDTCPDFDFDDEIETAKARFFSVARYHELGKDNEHQEKQAA